MTLEFAGPDTVPDIWYPADAEGHLLVIEPLYLEHGVVTSIGKSTALRANVHDITIKASDVGVRIFTGSLLQALQTRTGQRVLVRLKKGHARQGLNPPWLLVPESGSSESVEQATAYLASIEDRPEF